MSPSRRRPRTLADLAAAFTRRSRAHLPECDVPELRRPVRLEYGSTPVVQYDQTTCVSTCLLMLAAAGDPALVAWLEHGTAPAGPLPPEIPPHLLGAEPTVAQRLAGAQQRIKDASLAHAIGPFRWPGALGTPPWGAARQARFPGVAYGHVPVDDRGEQGLAAAARVGESLARGIPVIIYTGGSLATGAVTAMPRHAVLALPDAPGTCRLYEPSSGLIHHVPLASLAGRTARSPEFGNWTHMQWLVLPKRRLDLHPQKNGEL